MKTHKHQHIPPFNFHILTGSYDFMCSLFGFGEGFKAQILNLAKIKDGETVLDVGSGTGTLVILAKKKFPNSKVIALDPDERAQKIAMKKTNAKKFEITFLKSGGEKIPLKDSSVDVAISVLAFHHIPSELKKQVLQEIRRTLRKDGRFLLADFGEHTGPFSKLFQSFISVLNLPESKSAKDNFKGKIPVLLRQAGFIAKEVRAPYRGVRFLLAYRA